MVDAFDLADPLHAAIADAGQAAATGAAHQLAALRAQRSDPNLTAKRGNPRPLTVTIARRELRQWLRTSPEGKAVENLVSELLGSG